MVLEYFDRKDFGWHPWHEGDDVPKGVTLWHVKSAHGYVLTWGLFGYCSKVMGNRNASSPSLV